MDFIRQIEQADFGDESDVKLLYKKAKACELYCEAFGAEKTSEDRGGTDGGPPEEWIGINIRLFNFGIFIQSVNDAPRGGCCVRFDNEENLRKAYDLLSKEAEDCSLRLDYHWTPLAAHITDKFGVGWFFAM